MKRQTPRTSSSPPARGKRFPPWELRLYVAGHTPNSTAALANLKQICEDYLDNQCRLDIVDLLARPELARIDQIVALPTLIRRQPLPSRRIIGDLSDTERVLATIGIPHKAKT